MTDTPYPDVPADAEGGDALVRILSDMDEDHFTKAVMLVGAARREWQLAVQAGDVPDSQSDVPFVEFVEVADGEWADAIASAEAGHD